MGRGKGGRPLADILRTSRGALLDDVKGVLRGLAGALKALEHDAPVQ